MGASGWRDGCGPDCKAQDSRLNGGLQTRGTMRHYTDIPTSPLFYIHTPPGSPLLRPGKLPTQTVSMASLELRTMGRSGKRCKEGER